MMRGALKIVRFIVMVITGVCGTFLNSIIVVLNFRFWRDITASESYNKMLFIIGLMNMLFQGCLIFDTIFETYDLYFRDKNRFLLMFTVQSVLIGVNIGNTTWLSIFCCLRLLNSSHWLFLKIKTMFFTFFPHLIVGSVLVSAVINIPSFWTTVLYTPQNLTDYPMSGYVITMGYHYIICSSLFCIAFFMTCVSIGLSVATLSRHIWGMGRGDSHLTPAQLQGHYRAVRTMVIRVLLDFLFFFITVIGISVPLILNSPVFSISWITVQAYPTFQAFVLIFGNPKLKRETYGLIKSIR